MTRRMIHFIPALAALVLLIGVTLETLARPRAADAEPFHRHILEESKRMPMTIGPWRGQDLPVPPAAVTLLKPNVLIQRRFVNSETGRSAEFLLVQCRDARDMAGHYPPVCYPAHGYESLGGTPREWQVNGKTLPGMEYQYRRMVEGQTFTRMVNNLMILPDGRYVRDMREIRQAAADYLRQFYGATQVQVVLDAEIPAEERHEIVRTMLEAHAFMLDAVSAGGTR